MKVGFKIRVLFVASKFFFFIFESAFVMGVLVILYLYSVTTSFLRDTGQMENQNHFLNPGFLGTQFLR